MKTEEVIQNFVKGETSGNASSVSIKSDGKNTYLYSYATIIAFRDNIVGQIYITDKKYSSTTTTQQNMVKRLDNRAIVMKEEDFRHILGNPSPSKGKLGSKIYIRKKWISTDGWRGYETFENAFAGVNSTGNYEDSPTPQHEADKSVEIFKKYLNRNGIKFKSQIGTTSNVFSANMFFITSPEMVQRAKEVTKKYIQETGDDNVWVE